MTATIFTLGYTNVDMIAFEAVIKQRKLTIMDTRITPYSPHEEWQKANLAARFGKQYVHMREFGNKAYRSGGIEIEDLPRGIEVAKMFLSDGISVVLLCACKSVVKCHRLVVATALASATGCNVVHLLPQDFVQSSIWWQL